MLVVHTSLGSIVVVQGFTGDLKCNELENCIFTTSPPTNIVSGGIAVWEVSICLFFTVIVARYRYCAWGTEFELIRLRGGGASFGTCTTLPPTNLVLRGVFARFVTLTLKGHRIWNV